MLEQLGEIEQATNILKDGIQKIGNYEGLYQLYRHCAELLERSDQIDEAANLLREGISRIAHTQSRNQLYFACGMLLRRHNRIDEAITLLRQSIDHIPPEYDLQSLYWNCGNLLAQANRTDEAIELLRQGIERIPPEYDVRTLYTRCGNLLAQANCVDEVKVFKGVFSPAYESRVGGVVEMSLSDSVANTFHGGAGTTFTEAHAYVEVPLVENKLSIIASGRNTLNQLYESSTLGNYSTKVFQETKVEEIEREENDVNQILKYYDWNGKLIFRPSEKVSFSGSYYKSSNEFNYRAVLFEDELESTDRVNFDSDALGLKAGIQWFPNLSSHFSFANSTYSNSYFFNIFNLEDEEDSFTNNVFNEIKDRTYSWSNTWDFSGELNFDFGYDFNEKDVRFNIETISDFELDYEDFNILGDEFHSLHAAFQFSKKDFQVNGGMRGIYSNISNGWDFSPRLNMQYSWSKNLKFKFSAGILKQYIGQLKEFGDNDLGLNNQVWVLSQNETESSQTANKIAGGFVFRKKGWLIDMESYYTKTIGLNTLSPSFGTNTGIEDFASGSSKASGLDFLLKKKWKGFNSWVSYSFGKIDFLFPK